MPYQDDDGRAGIVEIRTLKGAAFDAKQEAGRTANAPRL
jgi:hypothetical protein